jgi:type II secretion system protein G
MTQSVLNDTKVPRNSLAAGALVLGIAGLMLSLPVIGGLYFGQMGEPFPYPRLWLSLAAIGGLLGLVAVVLGFIAFTRPGKKGMAIAGIGISLLFLPVALLAMGAWVMVFVFGFGPWQDLEGARRGGTIAEIYNLKTALGVFETDVGRYPTQAEGLQALLTCPAGLGAMWKGPYVDMPPMDKWGHPLIYRCPGLDDPTSYDLTSAGPNGIEGDDDDINKYTLH